MSMPSVTSSKLKSSLETDLKNFNAFSTIWSAWFSGLLPPVMLVSHLQMSLANSESFEKEGMSCVLHLFNLPRLFAHFLCKVLHIWFFVRKIVPAMSTFNMLLTPSFSLESFLVTVFYRTFECVILLWSPEFKLDFFQRPPLYSASLYSLTFWTIFPRTTSQRSIFILAGSNRTKLVRFCYDKIFTGQVQARLFANKQKVIWTLIDWKSCINAYY